MAEKLLSPEQVAARLGIGRTTVFRWAREGILPPAVRRLGKGRKGGKAWRMSAIDLWDRTATAVGYVTNETHKRDRKLVDDIVAILKTTAGTKKYADGRPLPICVQQLTAAAFHVLTDEEVPLSKRAEIAFTLMRFDLDFKEEPTGTVIGHINAAKAVMLQVADKFRGKLDL